MPCDSPRLGLLSSLRYALREPLAYATLQSEPLRLLDRPVRRRCPHHRIPRWQMNRPRYLPV